MKSFNLFRCLIILVLLLNACQLSGCGVEGIPTAIESATAKAVAALNQAIGELANANADWEQILKNLETEIPAELQSTIGFEVSRTLDRAVSASGSEVKCIIDFLHDRVREDLIRIRAKLLHQSIPPLTPVFCDVESVDMAMVNDGRQNDLLIYGYNFDIQNPVQVILNEAGHEVDVNAQQKNLYVVTHYKMELNLGRNGVQLSPQSQNFVIRWQGQAISEIPIIQPELPVCKTEKFSIKPNSIDFTPTQHTEGDSEFAGHGPKVYVRVQLWPQDLKPGGPWELQVDMVARETESDWTTVEGHENIPNFFHLPEGYVLNDFIRLRSETEYIDNNTKDDTEYPTSPNGPVNNFVIVGDTDDDDVGHTKVTVNFNTIEFMIRQVDNCR